MSRRVEQALEGLTLLDLSDREFLLVIRDAGGVLPEYVTAADVAAHLNLTGENPTRSVSSRLSWMRRYGAVEREYARDSNGNIIEHHKTGKPIQLQGWALSDLGFQMAVGKLSKTQQQSLAKLGDAQMLLTLQTLAKRVTTAETGASKLFDRAYRNGVGRR